MITPEVFLGLGLAISLTLGAIIDDVVDDFKGSRR